MGTRKRTKYSRIGARNPAVRHLQFLFAICPPASLREALRAVFAISFEPWARMKAFPISGI
jgi:hypothetical protein